MEREEMVKKCIDVDLQNTDWSKEELILFYKIATVPLIKRIYEEYYGVETKVYNVWVCVEEIYEEKNDRGKDIFARKISKHTEASEAIKFAEEV